MPSKKAGGVYDGSTKHNQAEEEFVEAGSERPGINRNTIADSDNTQSAVINDMAFGTRRPAGV